MNPAKALNAVVGILHYFKNRNHIISKVLPLTIAVITLIIISAASWNQVEYTYYKPGDFRTTLSILTNHHIATGKSRINADDAKEIAKWAALERGYSNIIFLKVEYANEEWEVYEDPHSITNRSFWRKQLLIRISPDGKHIDVANIGPYGPHPSPIGSTPKASR